jgi:hypothetical protein
MTLYYLFYAFSLKRLIVHAVPRFFTLVTRKKKITMMRYEG